MALSSMTGFRSRPRRRRRLCLELGNQIGQRQGPRPAASGCRRAGTRSKCRRAARAAEALSRGTVYANLTVERKGVAPAVKINEPVLDAVLGDAEAA